MKVDEALVERIRDIIDKHSYGKLVFTLAPDEDDLRLLDTYPDEIKAWRTFCQEVDKAPEEWEETHFHDVCRGFMAGRGVSVDDGHSIATFCRYNLQDFDPQLYSDAKK